ncbi:MAG: cupin domain-containing protein [Planctomycetota bacterium]
MSVTNLPLAASNLIETWSPRIVAEVNQTAIKVARIEGKFVWHEHEEEDEAFFVLHGEMIVRYRDAPDVALKKGDLHVVPRGISHCPVAEHECLIALIEPSTTKHTGNTISNRSRSITEQRSELSE